MSIFSFIDDLLNRVTMYKVVLYGLFGIAFFTLLFGFFGILPYNALQLGLSLCISIVSCFVINKLLSWFFHVPTNTESWIITALILYFIMSPFTDMKSALMLMLASIIGIASKYLVVHQKQHMFNPAAFGAFILSLFHQGAVWWIGSTVMTPIVAMVGLLIVRKERMFSVFLSFLFLSLMTIFTMSLIHHTGGISVVLQAITAWPLLFLGTVMVTEPSTLPPTKNKQMIYGSFIGFLLGAQGHVWTYSLSAEAALIIGNVYAYIVSKKTRLFLHLENRTQVALSSVDFTFTTPHSFTFLPGQYMEWTLPHPHPDSRGNRRYFTIASSPTEKNLMIGVRITPDGSSYKRTLVNLQNTDTIIASQLAGDFVLPDDPTKKLAFLAGGIGITPFRSMIKYLLDINQKRDIILLYAAKTADELAYTDLFDEAVRTIGIKVIYTLTDTTALPVTWNGHAGWIDAHVIQTEIPDYTHRFFYASGPYAMVSSFTHLLRTIGVSQSRIKTDFFPGYT